MEMICNILWQTSRNTKSFRQTDWNQNLWDQKYDNIKQQRVINSSSHDSFYSFIFKMVFSLFLCIGDSKYRAGI